MGMAWLSREEKAGVLLLTALIMAWNTEMGWLFIIEDAFLHKKTALNRYQMISFIISIYSFYDRG